MARTRRNQKAGGFLDWLFGKKNETVVANGATVPVENPVPTNAVAVQMNEVATPISAVGGARKHRKSYRKAHKGGKGGKAHRKARKDTKVQRKATKAQRKSRKSRKAQH